jgi:hypothetical protein
LGYTQIEDETCIRMSNWGPKTRWQITFEKLFDILHQCLWTLEKRGWNSLVHLLWPFDLSCLSGLQR